MYKTSELNLSFAQTTFDIDVKGEKKRVSDGILVWTYWEAQSFAIWPSKPWLGLSFTIVYIKEAIIATF